ncbi:unnamed protein product [Spirodela intermedia]|uniref:Uncharacterized protein n=1 Tax=Spirodela intermedia TaxID=51605 RepID=A0A7I8L1K9_SPIIN|nr:unnamed protein product [Spirodela intermedia]
MEMEHLEPRVKPLPFKVKAASRESSPTQKAAHLLEPDLRSHWSTGTNTKEWIVLELEEPCLLSHIRIYNKSVLEWEISVGLRYKPEAFVKVRPRCEAPRRDMIYPTNYMACRYVRVSCLRGNPISIFFMQLIGVSVTGLEPEFQPLVNYLLPHIASHKQDAQDVHLQLLRDITNRLLVFLPYLEMDLSNFTEESESTMRFLAMLAGPFYPLLQVVKEREAARTLLSSPDSEVRINQAPSFTVSSNFEVQSRRSRSLTPFQPVSCSIVFRPDVAFMLLRKAYKDPHLGFVCRLASRSLQKLVVPTSSEEVFIPVSDSTSSLPDETAKSEAPSHYLSDYSKLFGEEFQISDDHWEVSLINLLDITSVEEGVFHMLCACAAQPLLCCKLAESSVDFLSILPLVQALLPALRPPFGTLQDLVHDGFSQWNHPLVLCALSQIVAMSSSPAYYPLLHASAGYLSSFSVSQAKAACVMIDLCSGALAPWLPMVTAKVDLAIELIEDLLGVIQGGSESIVHFRSALKYIILALSGYVDDILAKYKEVKHKVLFLVEMLEDFLEPVMSIVKGTIAFRDASTTFSAKQEERCGMALNIIRTAVQKPTVLPSLEREWRRGSVAPSVILYTLGPNIPLPPEIDKCKPSSSKTIEREPLPTSNDYVHATSSKPINVDDSDGKIDLLEISMKVDMLDDANLLFAPPELKNTSLMKISNLVKGGSLDKISADPIDSAKDDKHQNKRMSDEQFRDDFIFDNGLSAQYLNLQANYLQLVYYEDCKSRASEFRQLALDLHSQVEITPESHDAAIDALLLAAECYVNPFFIMSLSRPKHLCNLYGIGSGKHKKNDGMELRSICPKSTHDLETIDRLERTRDKTVLEILLQAAKLDWEYNRKVSHNTEPRYDTEECCQYDNISLVDMQHADSITLVRQNQALLCQFVMRYLQKDQLNLHEILLQSLLFILQYATELFSLPEDVIDVILRSAEHLNGVLTSHRPLNGGTLQLSPAKLHAVQRHCLLLQKLVIASLGVDDEMDSAGISRNGFQYRSLVPPTCWIQKIPIFSSCPFPLARFLGWMAVSHLAKKYLSDQLFLTFDLSHLTSLLSVFADDLALTEDLGVNKTLVSTLQQTGAQQNLQSDKDFGSSDPSNDHNLFRIVHPDLYRFFPMMKNQFLTFGDTILRAVCLRLNSLPSAAVPDILCWFSDLCTSPLLGNGKDLVLTTNPPDRSRRLPGTNVKAIIPCVLEAIISKHLEAMLPEMPRVTQTLISLCRSSFCDVSFLDVVFALLKPLISYALRKFEQDEPVLRDEHSSNDLESLCFEEIFSFIKCKIENNSVTGKTSYNGSRVIFILGGLYPDLSFRRKKEILLSLLEWTDFTTLEPTTSFYDYLLAFQCVIDSCAMSLAQSLENIGIFIPIQKGKEEANTSSAVQLVDADGHDSLLTTNVEIAGSIGLLSIRPLSLVEVEEFSNVLESLVRKLCPAIEACWGLHFKLATKLTVSTTKCLLFLGCLTLSSHSVTDSKEGEIEDVLQCGSGDYTSKNWVASLEGLTEAILMNQRNHCWQVASCMLDYVFQLPLNFSDTSVIHICSVMKSFCSLAPRISWRLQTDKWLLSLIKRDISNLGAHDHLIDVFCSMLGHWEPEQRYIALRHLGRLVGLDVNDGVPTLTVQIGAVTFNLVKSAHDSILSKVISGTWDRVASVASSDPSMQLRAHAMALLSGFVPFTEQSRLQSFLAAVHTLPGLGRRGYTTHEVPFTRLSIGLLASACLYSSFDDVSLISDDVWQKLEYITMSKTGFDAMEKSVSEALCKLRTEFNDAKEVLKGVLSSSSSPKHSDPAFNTMRESILQVISSLASVQAYFDFFSQKIEKEAQELDEAEIELELLQKERTLQNISEGPDKEAHLLADISNDLKDVFRLQQIKEEIRSIEKSKLKEEIIVRRQRKLLVRRGRQKYLEEAALREMELLQELDRERTSEAEREIEQQRLLETERAKTRELRYNLELERERQAQRELQKELELVESGVRSSRRDISSNPSSRPRERYRERDNGRTAPEGSSRGRDGGTFLATAAPGSTLVLAGSRSSFLDKQPPTILQPLERADERGPAYEDNYEGGRDSGDASSVGDPETASLEAGGFGSAPRQGRGGKSRQIVERREREGRREGKWERKHS